MIDERNFFYQPAKNNLITYDNIRKIATGHRDGYTSGCLLDSNYFKTYYKMIAIKLNRQQAHDADSKAEQQINFSANKDRKKNTTMFFIIKEMKKIILDFSQGTVKVLWI